MYTVTFLFKQGRRCFALAVEYSNPIRIDHVTCDELLTIVVLALVIRIVHGRGPTAVCHEITSISLKMTFNVALILKLVSTLF